jgi:hypothetical protein
MNRSREDFASALLTGMASEQGTSVLATLLSELTLAARGSYEEAGLSLDESYRTLRCLNELQIVVAKQLRAAVAGTDLSYPEAAFVQVLIEKARVGACSSLLETAARRAVLPAVHGSDGAPAD